MLYVAWGPALTIMSFVVLPIRGLAVHTREEEAQELANGSRD